VAIYRIYIDEVGNHDMKNFRTSNERFLSLTGVVIEREHLKNVIKPEMEQLKNRFQSDPDEPVIFHRKEIINFRGPFHTLRDENVRKCFDESLLRALKDWEYTVITVIIDKLEHKQQYQTWQFHPYHYCIQVLLERFILFLEENDGRGDAMVESRGRAEDEKLKKSYSRLFEKGTDFVSAEQWQSRLSSGQLKLKPKSANIPGLQLADLIAYPSRKSILVERNIDETSGENFGTEIAKILEKYKYRRNPYGQIWGFGKKMLP